MKIGIITNLYPPFSRGGAEIVAAIQAEELKKSWQHVFVVSTKPRLLKVRGESGLQQVNNYITKDEVNGIPVYRFTPANLYYYLDDFKFPGFIRFVWHLIDTLNIFSYFTIKKILQSEKPDVVITHNLMGLGFLTPLLLRKLAIKHVHIVHDVQLVTPSGLIIKGRERAFVHRFFKAIGYIKLMKKLFGSPSVVMSPSRFLQNFYAEHDFFSKSKKIVLPNPVKVIRLPARKPSYQLELLYLGQISKAKGVLELINSFSKIKQSNLRLHIVGVGPDSHTAIRLAKKDKRISYHGWIPHNNLIPLMSNIDVMVVPSLCYENSPTVIYEALAMGIPVLAADIGGVAELISEGKNGWIFPAGNFDVMNRKILSLFSQRDKLKDISQSCQNSVLQYNSEKYAEKILQYIS